MEQGQQTVQSWQSRGSRGHEGEGIQQAGGRVTEMGDLCVSLDKEAQGLGQKGQ